MLVGRALLIWLLLMVVESGHGALRTLVLAPAIGGLPARRLSVLTGAVLALFVTLATIRWIRARSAAQLLEIGSMWVILTVAFELSLGRLILNLDWPRILSDYDLRHGGLMPVGLVAMVFIPWIAARIRGREEPAAGRKPR